jgi:hypothetical protein
VESEEGHSKIRIEADIGQAILIESGREERFSEEEKRWQKPER